MSQGAETESKCELLQLKKEIGEEAAGWLWEL